MEILINVVNNGFSVVVSDSTKSGNYVFRSIDDIIMMQFIGKVLLDSKVEVIRK